MDIPIESTRLKKVREDLKLTQVAFGKKLDINSTADIERGRTKLSGQLVMILLRDYNINPLWLYGESKQQRLDPNDKDVIPRTITVDQQGNENILLVGEKAAAGYADNLTDPEYIESLPAFTFPLPEYRNATFRGFQVDGYSMLPSLMDGEWIIAQAITNLQDIRNGNIYVVIEEQGIRVKKLINYPNSQELELISINPDYPTARIAYSDVVELWEFHSKLTQEIITESQNNKLEAIHEDIKAIKKTVEGGKGK